MLAISSPINDGNATRRTVVQYRGKVQWYGARILPSNEGVTCDESTQSGGMSSTSHSLSSDCCHTQHNKGPTGVT